MNALPTNIIETKTKSVLIIEDEPHIADLIELTLKPLDLDCIKVSDIDGARRAMASTQMNLVLIDWMLPGQQGIDFLAELYNSGNRENFNASWMQTMMITAKGDTTSIVTALNQGADDYVVKPFVPDILLARVQNLLRRSEIARAAGAAAGFGASAASGTVTDSISEGRLEHAGLEIDFDRVEVHIASSKIQLTQSEFKLLGHLIKSKGKVLSREHLIEKIQGHDVSVTNRTIDTHVFALRKKLGTWSNQIETIRGVGYRVHFDPQQSSSTEEEIQ